MDAIRLGMTDLSVSPIALGTWELGGEWGTFSEQRVSKTIRRARELGINLFDTAQGYGFGASERLLGRALRTELDTHRETVVIATKGGLRMTGNGLVRDASREWLRHGVDDSLHALGVEYIDLYQVHWPDPNVSFAETADALAELAQEGKIRHVGVSNFSATQMAEFATTRPVETNQVPYSLFRRDIEADVLPYARQHDIGILAYGPLSHGLLTGALHEHTVFEPGDWRNGNPSFAGDTYHRNLEIVGELQRFAAQELGSSVAQLALAWTLANPAVHVAIVGARNSRHIEEAVATTGLRLGQHELDRIDHIMAGAMAFTGPAPELMPTR
jgi:aryl-alcohol dehydrogenase-like predicted oxidoreductase